MAKCVQMRTEGRGVSFIFVCTQFFIYGHNRQKEPSSLTQFTIAIENSNTSKYSTAVEKKEREGKENNAYL